MSDSKTPKAAKRRPRRSRLAPLINRRRAIQFAVGAALWWAIVHYHLSLWWVIAGALAAGLILGKFFCRWMCPMGAMMEIMTGLSGPDSAHQRYYSYFKLGCPISWGGGLLNKLSLFRVKLDPERCRHCSRCDEACYVAHFAEERSLHQPGQLNASTHYSCSRCLRCVEACPAGALTVGPSLPFKDLIAGTRLNRQTREAD